ncbi:hypothetical protein JTB14_014714 [Gonioctena quinquepunctata]|nr:hypothetical protein JTB14_014714 [Gonioctena quinquepunctata]
MNKFYVIKEFVKSMVMINKSPQKSIGKIHRGHQVTMPEAKWNDLRNYFSRELDAKKNTKSRQAMSKRRKYVYFDNMLFLLPCIDNLQTDDNIGLAVSHDDADPEELGPPTSTPTPVLRRGNKTIGENRSALDAGDEAPMGASKVTRDKDTNFALLLVPSLQALTPEGKLVAKNNYCMDIQNCSQMLEATYEEYIPNASEGFSIHDGHIFGSIPIYEHAGDSALVPSEVLKAKIIKNAKKSDKKPAAVVTITYVAWYIVACVCTDA